MKPYDIVIKGARIIDGTGSQSYNSDIGISGDRIGLIGAIPDEKGGRIIDAEGMVASPGFVDIHSHSDYYLLIDRRGEGKIRQGVTTEIGGNCGYSAAPICGEEFEERKKTYKDLYGLDADWKDLDDYFERLETGGLPFNFGLLIGHNTIRGSIMGARADNPSESEMGRMLEMVKSGMENGAVGISTGLIYPPACFSEEEEIIRLCQLVKDMGGIFTIHMRSEGDLLAEAVEEAIRISSKSGIPLQISHLKTAGKKNWEKIDKVFSIIEEARVRGIDVTADRYPYTAGNTLLSAIMPNWVLEGGRAKGISRIKDLGLRKKIEEELSKKRDISSFDRIIISQVFKESNKAYEGLSVLRAAGIAGKDLYAFLFDLLAEEEMLAEGIFFSMDEENLKRILSRPYVMVASDSASIGIDGPLSKGRPHPRGFGAFPRVISKYVREERVLDLVTAIKKMTYDPCRKFGITDRGTIKTGSYADIVLFDPEKIKDLASYDDPKQFPDGIAYVVLNGEITLERGNITSCKAGRVLRRGA
ncbi:MAG: D-aminoacylase [Nitrospirae bacterium]|nr:D-aminoacylase [Nitrospirota bacterium]